MVQTPHHRGRPVVPIGRFGCGKPRVTGSVAGAGCPAAGGSQEDPCPVREMVGIRRRGGRVEEIEGRG